MKRNSVKQTMLEAGEIFKKSAIYIFRKIICYIYKRSIGCLGKGNRTTKSSWGKKMMFLFHNPQKTKKFIKMLKSNFVSQQKEK